MKLAAELRARPVKKRLYTLSLGYIHSVRENFSLSLLLHRIEFLLPSAGHGDLRTFRSQSQGDRLAHASAASNNQCVLILQAHVRRR